MSITVALISIVGSVECISVLITIRVISPTIWSIKYPVIFIISLSKTSPYPFSLSSGYYENRMDCFEFLFWSCLVSRRSIELVQDLVLSSYKHTQVLQTVGCFTLNTTVCRLFFHRLYYFFVLLDYILLLFLVSVDRILTVST